MSKKPQNKNHRSAPTRIEIHKNSETEMDLGNTLEFYNDELSRKAVGKLFEPQPDSPEDEEDEVPTAFKNAKNVFFNQEDDEDSKKSHLSYIYTPDDEDIDYSVYRRKQRSEAQGSKPNPRSTKPRNRYNEIPLEQPQMSEAYSPELPAITRTIIAAGAFIFLIVLTVMIVNINSMNAKLRAAEDKVKQADDIRKQLSELTIKYDDLQSTNKDLTAQLERIQVSETSPSQDQGEVTSQEPSTDTASSSSGLPTTYSVQSGDNLSKISKRFYGNTTDFQKIKDANNLKNDDIFIGQNLIIPE